MRGKNIIRFICVFAFLSCAGVKNKTDNNLLDVNLFNEYKLLHTDLSNVRTWGYKSYFNKEINRADEKINVSQGALVFTELKTDIAITREGFFKIRLENDLPGYTRFGNFKIDADGNLVTPNGYPLYDNISFEEYFVYNLIRITKDHNVYVSIPERNGVLTEKYIGKILTYNVPNELLRHYEDAIYVIKDNVEFTEEVTFCNSIEQGFLEYSNVFILPAVLRMYYILSVIDKNFIPNIEFKKELLSVQIERFADDDYILLLHETINLNNKLIDIIEKNSSDSPTAANHFNYEQNAFERYLDSRFFYLGSILPFIKHDY